uniref:Strictosidine synthase conserved region domain-containing protein n=1 Tax=Kalanchoe fedtschenkoi TaxID=63787 RepID=A0A7N0USU9_KALFE
MMNLSTFAAAFILLLAAYCKLDPFHHSAIADFPDFRTFPVDMPPWSEIPTVRDPRNRLRNSEIKFLDQVQGPESIAFDPVGRGPYTGVADGRVVVWTGGAWSTFAETSPNRSEICDWKPAIMSYLKHEHVCGRPLGLRFDKRSGDLYIADAYLGLLKVGPEGGLATPLVTEAEGVPLRFANDLDIDDDGNVYFTDSSSLYQRRNYMQLVFSGESSGRVLKYDPIAKQTTVLLRDIMFPNGLSLSKDGEFLVFSQASGRLRRYWLKGEKAGTSEIFANLPGSPDNVRVNEKGEFWVAIHSFHTRLIHFSAFHPTYRKFLLKLPVSAKLQFLFHQMGLPGAIAVKYSVEGELMEILEDGGGKVVKLISEVHERDGKLWLGSVLMPYIAVYNLE